MPNDGAGQFAYWKREMERRTGNLERARNAQFTKIYDEDGNLLGSLSAAGLEFFNADGDRISSLDGDGLSVYDDDGVAQLRAGDLDGAGDYGVEIGGGRARPLDIDTHGDLRSDLSLTTTEQVGGLVTFTPPAWATSVVVIAQSVFQMHNNSGATQHQHFRIDVDGFPGTGLWSNYVANGMTANVADAFIHTIPADGAFDVEVIVRVNTGTNNINHVRLYTQAIYLR